MSARFKDVADKLLELVVLGGFLALNFALMNFVIPTDNKELFGQALGALTVIATLVAKSLWERGSATAQETSARQANLASAIDKIPVPTATPAGTPDDPLSVQGADQGTEPVHTTQARGG